MQFSTSKQRVDAMIRSIRQAPLNPCLKPGVCAALSVSDYDNNPDHGIAALDAALVTRTRPIGGPNYRTLRACGQSPLVERRTFCKKHDTDPKIVTHHAVDRNGRLLTAGRSHRLFDLRRFPGCMRAMGQSPDRGGVVRRMCKFIARTLTQTPCRIVDLNAMRL